MKVFTGTWSLHRKIDSTSRSLTNRCILQVLDLDDESVEDVGFGSRIASAMMIVRNAGLTDQ